MLKNKSIHKVLILFIVIFMPWFNSYASTQQDTIPSLSKESVGFYQSNSCNISLVSFLTKNSNFQEYEYRFESSVEIPCTGKVQYIEPVDDGFIVFIGFNSLISIALQTSIWLFFISLIKAGEIKKKSPKNISILSILMLIHLISESTYYSKYSSNFSIDLNFDNYFLFSYFLTFLLVSYFIDEICTSRSTKLIYYLPFIVLFQGTFLGMNLNFFVLILMFFGLKNFTKNLRIFNSISLVLIFLILNTDKKEYLYFDVDKLRGFSSSSSNFLSLLFWSLSLVLIINGIYYIVSETTQVNHNLLIKNFILSGFLVVVFGILSSSNILLNRLFFLLFGQNKVSSENIFSVAGNSWRGFSPSAEMIGEFYGLIFLITFLKIINNKITLKNYEYIFLVFIFYGFFRANNIASLVALISIVIYFLIKNYIRNIEFRILLYIFVVSAFLVFGYFIQRQNTYSNMSQAIINESLLLSNVDSHLLSQRDYLSILDKAKNGSNISTSLEFITKKFASQSNIPVIPNPIALLSVLSLLINRSEKWGVFFAKYDPNFQELFFGYGGLNLVNYNFDNSIISSGLVLPHSSFLSILVFFGLIGIVLFVFTNIFLLYKNKNNYLMFYAIVYLFINFIKSDSLLYPPIFIIYFSFLFLLNKKTRQSYE